MDFCVTLPRPFHAHPAPTPRKFVYIQYHKTKEFHSFAGYDFAGSK